MFRYSKLLVLGALSLSCGAYVSLAIAADAPYVTAAVQSPARPPQQMKRDTDRKPADLMTFAGIKPGDKIAELTPRTSYDGYFTMVLSKIVGTQGKVYAFVPHRGYRDIESQRVEEQKQRAAGKPPAPISLDTLLAIQHTTDYKNIMSICAVMAGGADRFEGDFGLPEQVDAVFTGAGYHELHNKVDGPVENGPLNMVNINKAIFRAMKPGAVYVVSDYAAAKGAGVTQTEGLNRIEADTVKSEVTAAGFTFDGESNVLMNDDDLSKPASGDKSARFVLRFRKPANASPVTKRHTMNDLAQFYGNTQVSGTPEDRGRTMLFHADGSYQEFGINDVQLASIYFDADGNECMYHEYPVEQEGFVVCHLYGPETYNAKVGDTWIRNNGNRYSLVKGYVYPNRQPGGRGGQQQQPQARPTGAQ